jgi:hypothetical protein
MLAQFSTTLLLSTRTKASGTASYATRFMPPKSCFAVGRSHAAVVSISLR